MVGAAHGAKEPDVQERERDTGMCVDEMEAREHDKDGLLALPASPYPWDPSIKYGRRRGSQEWCRRKGRVPDACKGKGDNKGFKKKRNMPDVGDEPDVEEMEAR